MENQFTHLHVHSEYSLLDGACRVKELVAYVKTLGQTSIAITDHGCMYGVIDFYNEAIKQGVKPIIGCEVYVANRSRHDKEFSVDKNPYHLVLLCEDNEGYQNLVKMVSLSHVEGFYSKPRVDLELLQKYHKGLICLSGCVIGEVARNLSSGNYQGAKDVALKYQEIFGKGNYFLEVQNHGLQSELRVLPMLYKLSEETGIPLVATNDAHYTKKSDAEVQDILLCIQTQTTLNDPKRMKFQTEEFYVKSYEEMYRLFSSVPQALSNTQTIADRCNVTFEFGKVKLPKYQHGVDDDDNVEYFKTLCYDGLKRRYGEYPSQEVSQRMDYEIDVIAKMGYVDYFLIVWDYINYARTNDIPVGCGRGSGAGSICAYCMGITNVDPIKHSLLFERFLNPERVSMPDFDIDFCVEGRAKVIEYVTKRYGADRVSQIITFGTMGARSSIRDVGRVIGLSYSFCSKVANYIPIKVDMTIDKALEGNPDFRKDYDSDPQVKRLVDTAKRLEGMPRNTSTHAAGVIISAEPIMNLVPISKNDGVVVTQYTMGNLESLGLLKMDFLGLRNLTIIKKCQEYIRLKEPSFNVDNVPLDDAEVFDMLARGNTLGVFQFESSGITDVLVKLVPKDIEDLIAVLSLYRPGPMDSIPQYIANRHNPDGITYDTPKLKPILELTYGCIVYQEQVMEICRSLANYSYGHADIVRRAMAKKKHEVMLKERESFVDGCSSNGIDSGVANKIFDQLVKFSAYAFNKSHATCYAYLSYQTAYLRCHYFKEYMASLMSSVQNNTVKLMEYIAECEKHGVKVLKPYINTSCEDFTISEEENAILFGLLAIKGVGKDMVSKIVQEREQNGKFTSIKDFCKRMSQCAELNKRSIESLIKAGAFDGLTYNRRQMLSSLDEVLKLYQNHYYDSVAIEGQLDLLGEMTNVANKDYVIPNLEEFSKVELLDMEKDMTGMYISGHPLNDYTIYVNALRLDTITAINKRYSEGYTFCNYRFGAICYLSEVKPHTTKRGTQMAFITVEDVNSSIDGVVFPSDYPQLKRQLAKDTIVYVWATINTKDGSLTMAINSIVPMDAFLTNPCYYANRFPRFLELSTIYDRLPEVAKLCGELNTLGGNVPIGVKILDRRQRFIPKRKPTTTLDANALALLKQSGVNFEYWF